MLKPFLFPSLLCLLCHRLRDSGSNPTCKAVPASQTSPSPMPWQELQAYWLGSSEKTKFRPPYKRKRPPFLF